MVLASSLSEEEVALLIADLPDRQIPTHDHLSYHDFLVSLHTFLFSMNSIIQLINESEFALDTK